MKKCCIVIITHKEKLDGNDELSLKQALNVFGKKYDIKLVIPQNISTNYYDKYLNLLEYVKVNDEWLSSVRAYNKMQCSKEFYELFKEYEYILNYETDAWVFEDKLDYFIKLGYDYYGAPWPHLNDKIGNSGFSLRKVNKMIDITSKYVFNYDSIHSSCDTWVCINHGNELNICDLETACNFSMENITSKYLAKIKTIPMGLHGKFTMNLWDENGNKFLKLK